MKTFPQITHRQLLKLTEGSKHWSEKKVHLIKIAKSCSIVIETNDELQELIEVHCPKEARRLHWESQARLRTDKHDFATVDEPIIGRKYHLAWAVKGAVFILMSIEDEYGYFDNPKYKRKDLLKAKLSDMRHLRQRKL